MNQKLYIKIDENGMFVDHPHLLFNMLELYPNHDFNSGPPSGWMEFERFPPPVLGPYEKFDEAVGGNIALAFPHNGLEYAVVDGKYRDIWHVLPMTAEEKANKIARYKAEWNEYNPGVNSWIFNEELCRYEPPIPYPDSDDDELKTKYVWDESTLSWVLAQ